jgi:hypothetical protein
VRILQGPLPAGGSPVYQLAALCKTFSSTALDDWAALAAAPLAGVRLAAAGGYGPAAGCYLPWSLQGCAFFWESSCGAPTGGAKGGAVGGGRTATATVDVAAKHCESSA